MKGSIIEPKRVAARPRQVRSARWAASGLARVCVMTAQLVLGAAGTGHHQPVNAEPLPVETFAKKPVFTGLKLSPDGRYIAALVPSQRNSSVVMINVADSKPVGQLRLDPDDHVTAFWWTGNNRIVAALGRQYGPLDPPIRSGELVSVDAEGRDFQYLFGSRGVRYASAYGPGRNAGRAANAWMIESQPPNPDEIVIGTREWGRPGARYEFAQRLNLKTGLMTQLAMSPVIGADTSFVIDAHGEVRYAITSEGAFDQKTWQRNPPSNDWQRLQVPGDSPPIPLQFSRDGNSVYLKSREFGPRACLVQHVLSSGERRKLACDEASDLADTVFSFEPQGEPIAAVFAAGRPEMRLLESAHPHRQLLKELMAAFPGKLVEPTSFTRDGKTVLVLVIDDRTPGDYYLFDTASKKASYFAAVRDWIDPDLMSERRPIKVEARDGTSLYGYLTLPRDQAPKKLPLVVNPHGGPFYVRDHWVFDAEAQMLANRGYAVLQINFRGSGGYGSQFVLAGKKAWATTMIDDIIDATRWTVDQGFADPSRICIYGASYGGYAALMSAEREPDLYRCVIGYAGVYDLKRFKKDSDISDTEIGREYFSDAIAGSEAEMVARSPVTYVDKLKAPMLIVHGEEDPRAPLSQAKALRKALEAGNHPFEWMIKPEEGHGFWRPENILAFDNALLDFLDRNIGAAAAEQK